MKTQEQKLLRKKILDACMNRQQVLIDDFTSRIKNILQHEGLGNEDEYDNSELAQDSLRYEEINILNDSLNFVTADMNVLRYLTALLDVSHNTPERGAFVITNRGNYFISVGIGQVELDGKTFITLSSNSQLFTMMKGKYTGQSFEFNRIKYHIEEIF